MVTMVTKPKRGIRHAFSGSEWRRLGALYAFVALLHLVGWGTLIFVVSPRYPSALGIGVGLTAYLFGLRHAFDADHISAIDNTTRKLLADGKRPMGVGFFFSLGHSTVVFVLAIGLNLGVRALGQGVTDERSLLHHYTGLIGTS